MSDRLGRLEGARTALGVKAPVRAASTANLTLEGYQTIDGVAFTNAGRLAGENMRVLVKDQTNPVNNGIYIVDQDPWVRAKDFDGNTDFVKGTIVPVAEGDANGASEWRVDSDDPPSVGEDDITFATASIALFGFEQDGAGAVVRTALEKMRDLCDLRDFDDIDFNGNNDSASGYQKAINQAQTAKTTLHLPGGTPAITSELSITAALKMLGSGQNKASIWLGATNINGLHINTNDAVILEDFQIVGSNNGTTSLATAGSLIRVTAPDVNRLSHFNRLRLLFGQTSIHYHRAETWTLSKSYLLGHKPSTGVGIINENVGYPGNGENILHGVLIAGDNSAMTGTGFLDRSSVNTHFSHCEFFQWDNGYTFEPNVATAIAGKYFTNPVFSQVDNAVNLNKGSCTQFNHFIMMGGQIVARNCVQSDSNNNWLYDLSIFGTQLQCGAGNTAGNGTAIALPAAKSPKINCSVLGASGDDSAIVGANCDGGKIHLSLRGAVNAPSNSSTTTIVTYERGTGVEFTDKPLRLPSFELGHDTDTTFSRTGAGAAAIEGKQILLSGVATPPQVTNGTTQSTQCQYKIASVNFDSANTDNPIVITLPTGFTRYRIGLLEISGASASLTTATFGFFTAAGAGGVAIIAAGTAITVSTNSENTTNNAQSFFPASGSTTTFNASTLYFRIGTAQGSAATADVTLILNFF